MNKERGIGIAMMAGGAIMCLLTSQIKTTGVASAGDIGSRFFPYLSAVCLILCGLGVFISAKKYEKGEAFLPEGGFKRVMILLAVLFVYTVMLYFLGFLISSPILLFVLSTLLAGDKKLPLVQRILFSVIVTVLVFLFFEKLLNIILPSPIFF